MIMRIATIQRGHTLRLAWLEFTKQMRMLILKIILRKTALPMSPQGAQLGISLFDHADTLLLFCLISATVTLYLGSAEMAPATTFNNYILLRRIITFYNRNLKKATALQAMVVSQLWANLSDSGSLTLPALINLPNSRKRKHKRKG